jgi:dipeptidyl aminopeptidase/acylaminoacyl peptidase
LFGERDERVPPVRSSRAIVAALHAGGNRNVTLRMFPGADHTFSLPTPKGGWPKHVPDYADAMIAWARDKTK